MGQLIVLRRTCAPLPNGSYQETNVFYTTARLGQNPSVDPLDTTSVPTLSCSPYNRATGFELERFCVTDSSGVGLMRVVTYDGNGGFITTDSPSTVCDGTCDMIGTSATTTPTSSPTTADGTITLVATTTHPPITCNITGLGAPTTTTSSVSTIGSAQVSRYEFVYNIVPAGNYTPQLQDNQNCGFIYPTFTVQSGTTTGTVINGVNWLKFETVGNGRYNGTPFTLQGYAWDNTTKSVYEVTNAPVTYPEFDDYTGYKKGDIMQFYVWRIFAQSRRDVVFYRAKFDMQRLDFPPGNRIPSPNPFDAQSTNEWEYIEMFEASFIQHVTNPLFPIGTKVFDMFFSKGTPYNVNINPFEYWYYPQDAVVRYEWDRFYRAKTRLDTRYMPGGVIAVPTGLASDPYWERVTWYDDFFYAKKVSDNVDSYAIGPLNRTVRYHVYDPRDPNYVPTASNGNGSQLVAAFDYLLFQDTTTTVETNLGDLKVIDIIKNDVDECGAENGSVNILATSPSLPIRYHLRNGVRSGYIQDNLTGIYEDLHPGHFIVDIYDAQNRYTSVEFDIEDRYKVRWKLLFDDLKSTPLELYIFERDWDGAVTEVCGSGEPVFLSWDNGGDPAGYLPEAVGANLEFNVVAKVAQQFVDTVLKDDRNHRIDYYRSGTLRFRGYIDTTSYQEAMLGNGSVVKLIATDGLGQLQNTKFINHHSEKQYGRTSMLTTVLKCLSFCDVNLPVWCGINLRDRLMTTTGDPLDEAYINRNAYDTKDDKVVKDEDFIDCRTVLDAILRVFNAVLYQVDGKWKIIELNKVHEVFSTRVWSPAGTLRTGINTDALPLRILRSKFATGPRELFWFDATQNRTTVAAAQIVKATVALKLEDNLFRNGNFTQWDETDTRPLYWSVSGSPVVARVKGEKAKEYALQFKSYTQAFSPHNYITSPSVPHMTGQDEDGYEVKFKALLARTTVDPSEVKASVFLQVVCEGVPFGQPIEVEVSSKDKWKEYTIQLPLGLPGGSVRVRLLEPQAQSPDPTTLSVSYVAISIQPGLLDWSSLKEDFFEATNDDSTITGIRLADVALAHADLPRLPGPTGLPLQPKKMDVYAWRHAVSLADFTATTSWKRPGYPTGTPLLENAALDRMALRAVPTAILNGDVMGPGVEHLRVGLMLDAPDDLDGKFMVVSCTINERKRSAQIVCRKMADGFYPGAVPEIPDLARIASARGKRGYRIATDSGTIGFRIAKT